jgi:6-phosphofructokinase 1
MSKQSITTLRGAVLVAQSGGPTSVINASTYGVIKTALASKNITRVFWAANGIDGVLEERLFDMNAEDHKQLELLKQTPAAAMGSCRRKIKEETELAKIVEVFKTHDIRYFFYNGGNDSMDTCQKIHDYVSKIGYDMRVIGIPKTIDNDLAATDHTPGFGSAAKYVATTCMELAKEAAVYTSGPVIVLEVMGRNAGWLTGASVLASHAGSGPDFIYMPEVAFDLDKFINNVEELHKTKKNILVVVSEGIMDANGKYITEYIAESSKDAFGHTQLGGLAAFLANHIKNRLNIKVRGIELNLLQRCAAHCASKTDVDEAFNAGRIAMESALAGLSGKMIAYQCKRDKGYKCEYVAVPLASVANHEKRVPLEWITPEGNFVTEEFIKYALPLIQGEPDIIRKHGLPVYANLKRILVE